MDEMPQYVVTNGLRKVLPHWHTGVSFVKGRWLGRTILDVLQTEFRSRNVDFYHNEILKERIQIVRKGLHITGPDLIDLQLENKDVLHLTAHKHEPLVVHQDIIPIIHESDSIVVANKPSSIPVHPTGRYYNNTLTELLKLQLDIPNIYPCHRLDKLTSGVLILGKTSKVAGEIQLQIKNRDVQKQYLARVTGQFPSQPLVCDIPVGNIDTKLGFECGVRDRKPATTEFTQLRYNPTLNESIVLCKPLTGRTHQIRIHLNYLNHPIVNDPLYGPSGSKIRHELMNSDVVTTEQFERLNQENMDRLITLKSTAGACEECGEELFDEPTKEELVLWLHAYKYSFDGQHFETAEPDWCDI